MCGFMYGTFMMLFVQTEFAPPSPQPFHYKKKYKNTTSVLKGQVSKTIEAQQGALDYSLKEIASTHF